MENEMWTGNPNGLPSEVIHEILSRLPVKSLCRFNCVSKSWHSLFSDSDFATMHFHKALHDKHRLLPQRRRVIFNDAAQNGLHSINLHGFQFHNEFDETDSATATDHDYVYSKLSGIWVSILGSCNGLLMCRLCDSRLYLVNPATKESKKLPKIETKTPWKYSDLVDLHRGLGKYSDDTVENVYGFGFDCSTFEHKVVHGLVNAGQGVFFSVYTLETDAWRDINDCPFPYSIHPNVEQGIMLNGDLHWLGQRVVPRTPPLIVIVSLRLTGTEEVQEIPLPPFENTNKIKLGVFREWLCVTHNSYQYGRRARETYKEFWVMTEYGVAESWTKIRVSIPYSSLSHSGFWTKSHDLMVFEEKLVMYNFSDESFRGLSIRRIGKVGSVETYLESLFSLQKNQKSKDK